jgi:tetratricopeptide (TPR) repeat protein
LSYDYSDLGWVRSRQGANDDALVSHRKALALREEAAKADPNDVRAANAVASSTNRIGLVLYKKQDLDASLSELQNAVALYQRLADRPSAPWQTVRDLADVHDNMGDTLALMSERRDVSAAARQALRSRGAGEYRTARELYEGLKARGVLPKGYFAHIGELQAEEDKLKPAGQ